MQGNPDWSKNILRVEVSCSFAEKRWSESNLPAKPPIDGSYFLMNGFPRRICVLSDAGHDNLIEPVMNIARWYQIRLLSLGGMAAGFFFPWLGLFFYAAIPASYAIGELLRRKGRGAAR